MSVALVFLYSLCLWTVSEAKVISHVVKETPEEILAYWTPERMKAAIPMPLPKEVFVDSSSVVVGKPGFSEPSPPAASDVETPQNLVGSPTPVPNPGTFPYIVVGKVFMTIGGIQYVCSGSSIQSNTVLTAGHCVFGYPNWASYFAFYPDYPNLAGSAATHLYAQTAFTNSSSPNFAYDAGMATFGTTAHFNSIGWSGTAWNQAVTSSTPFNALGFPAASPYNGNVMYQVTGNAVIPQTIGYAGTVEILNGMTGGCSGGPWWNLQLSGGPYANGANSFVYTSQPNYMYSSYYAQWFGDMYNYVIPLQLS